MEHAKSIMSALTTMQDSLLARKVSPGGPPVVLALFRPSSLDLCLAGFLIRALLQFSNSMNVILRGLWQPTYDAPPLALSWGT